MDFILGTIHGIALSPTDGTLHGNMDTVTADFMILGLMETVFLLGAIADGTHPSTVVGTIHGLMVDIMVVDMVVMADITVVGIIMDIMMVITQDLAVADLAEVPLLTELLTVDVQV